MLEQWSKSKNMDGTTMRVRQSRAGGLWKPVSEYPSGGKPILACNIQRTVRYTELSPARFKESWRYIASVVGRVKISILLWRYGRIAGKLVPPWGDGLARIDDISLLEVMRT
jgi:hypothetical protein